jgi:hypothetical protein
MKLKSLILAGSIALIGQSGAAIYEISNVVTGTGATDALFQLASGDLLSGGIVAMGYFPAGYTVSSSLQEINNTIANFTIAASALAGSFSPDLEGAFPGYVQATSDQDNITAPNPLIGRPLYVFVGNTATLAGSDQFALYRVATIQDDVPNEQTYVANGFGIIPTIGEVGTFVGNASGQGPSTYTTVQLVLIPEPSVALLGLLGGLGLLRRRR